MRVGAIEAGGTKFIVAVGDGTTGRIFTSTTIVTTSPMETVAATVGWLAAHNSIEPLEAIGVASFGPIDLHRDSSTYGFITSTPKPGWQHYDFVGAIRQRFPNLPIGFDTDVNGAALGEHHWGAARGLSDFVYVTIGTGIGGGAMVNGKLMRGLLHPEMGHLRLSRIAGDELPGTCPFHGECWEGLCCGPAMETRYGHSPADLPADHRGWQLEIGYIAQACATLACVLSPQRMILGGSVRKGGKLGEARFFEAVRAETRHLLNGYLKVDLIEHRIGEYIVPPALGDEAGVRGALALGRLAAVSGTAGNP